MVVVVVERERRCRVALVALMVGVEAVRGVRGLCVLPGKMRFVEAEAEGVRLG